MYDRRSAQINRYAGSLTACSLISGSQFRDQADATELGAAEAELTADEAMAVALDAADEAELDPLDAVDALAAKSGASMMWTTPLIALMSCKV